MLWFVFFGLSLVLSGSFLSPVSSVFSVLRMTGFFFVRFLSLRRGELD
jgi:hypothetical protein